MVQKTQQNGYALVTGASYGIGEEFARQLAARGWPLILVARSQDRLERLRASLIAEYLDIDIRCVTLDLASPGAPAELFQKTQAANLEVGLLINNAGFGAFGEFISIDRQRQRQMVDLNVAALVELSHLYLAPMKQRAAGGILNVASIVGFIPLPYCAVYAATKAFVRSFSEALHEEARQYGVQVMVVHPGSTKTNFFEVAGTSPFNDPSRMQTAGQVVRESLRAFDHGRSSIVTGASNRLLMMAVALVPLSWIAAIVGRQIRRKSKRVENLSRYRGGTVAS